MKQHPILTLALLLTAVSVHADDYWRTNATSADELDTWLRAIPENSAIHFGPGVFLTRGVWDNWLGDETRGFRIKSGWRISGSGTNSTIFRLVDVPVDGSGLYNQNAVFSTGGIGLYAATRPLAGRANVENVSIRDLQIDCNYPELARTKGSPELHLAAIQLLGNRGLRFENILVRNAACRKLSRGINDEGFVVYAYNPWSNGGYGDYTADRITITEHQGGYTSGICFNGNAHALIQNCTVDLISDGAQHYALNFAAGLHPFTIRDNTVVNATRGLNNDTGPVCSDGTISDNRLTECGTGMFLANTRASFIVSNSIALTGRGCGISVQWHPTYPDARSQQNVIRDNTILGPGGEGISLAFLSYDPGDEQIHWSSGNKIQNNVFGWNLENKLPPESAAMNVLRPGNRRNGAGLAPCDGVTQPANLAAIGFPSDLGRGSPCSYSMAKASGTGSGHIARVRIAGTALDVSSGFGDGSGYSDYTTGWRVAPGNYAVQAADLIAGQSYQMDLSAGGLMSATNVEWRVYVDWNHDGRFDGGDELVIAASKAAEVHQTIAVPLGLPGSTRMRVVLGIGRAPGPYDYNAALGEVEDYTITVLP